jgi:hypothetical protein
MVFFVNMFDRGRNLGFSSRPASKPGQFLEHSESQRPIELGLCRRGFTQKTAAVQANIVLHSSDTAEKFM